jgi:Protein of unknown function (DUF1579)
MLARSFAGFPVSREFFVRSTKSMKRSCLILVAMCIASILASAQMPPMPKPGPEQKKLDYFAGNWSLEGEMKPGPFGPGGKFTATEHNEWMEGGFFLVSHSEENSPMGKAKGLAIFGYNPEEKVYTYNGFNSMGEGEAAQGTLNGDTWTYTNEEKIEGKMIKGRFSITQLSATAYNFKFEMQPQGGQWATMMEGKATKK